jgi:Spy/CpxP family protein refolding chaperone
MSTETTTPSRFGRRALIAAGALLLALPATLAFAGGTPERFRDWQPPQSADDVREHMQTMADKVYERVAATDEQRDTIDGILDGFADTAWQHKQAARAVRKEVREILTAPRIDRDRLEDLREKAVARIDDGSKVLVDTLADIAEVFTPEQRAQIGDAIERFHADHGL